MGRTRHGSWSQEKALVSRIEAANLIRGLPIDNGVIPLPKDEAHVAVGRSLVKQFQTLLSGVVPGEGENKKAPSLVDFLF